MKLDLGAKMTGVVVGVMLGVVVVLLALVTVLERRRLAEAVDDRARVLTEATLEAAEAHLADREDVFDLLQPFAQRLGAAWGVREVQVLDEDGQTVAHTDPSRVGRFADAHARELAARALHDRREVSEPAEGGGTERFLPVFLQRASATDPVEAVVEITLVESEGSTAGGPGAQAVLEAMVEAVRTALEREEAHAVELRAMARHLIELPGLARVELFDAHGERVVGAERGSAPAVHAIDLFSVASRVLTDGAPVDLPGPEATLHQRFRVVERPDGEGRTERLGVVAMVLDESPVRAVVRSETYRLLGTLLALVVLVGAVSLAVLRAIVGRPIERLAAATAEAAQGHLQTALPLDSGDELALLAESFNRMTHALGEQAVSREYFEKVLHGIREGVVATDPSGCVVFANRAAESLFQRPSELLQGFPLGAVLVTRPSDLDLTDQGTPRFRETTLTQADGTHVPVLVSSTEIELDGDGGTVWVIEDLTERRDLEEQLRHSQKMEAVGRLAGGIAHDYNNYLTVITGYAEALLRMTPEGDRKRGFVQQILEAAESSATLTRRLLEFGRRQPSRPRPIDLGARLSRMHDVLARVLGERIRLETVLEAGDATVVMDPSQLEQLVLNLAVNAKDAMPEGGALRVIKRTVEVDRELAHRHPGLQVGPYVVLTVEDQGAGMDAETRARIFEPFFTTKAPGQGTGLGLPSVYGIVTQAGGHIEVDSTPGEGTAFHVYLPRVLGEPDPITTEVVIPDVANAATATVTVLVVEDQDMVRSLARDVLTQAGYRVLVAPSAEEAIATVGDGADGVDLLLTDVVMPGMGGRELARRLVARRPELPVVFMSGYDEVKAEGRQSKLGEMWLQKPFRSQELLDAVRSVLGAMA